MLVQQLNTGKYFSYSALILSDTFKKLFYDYC